MGQLPHATPGAASIQCGHASPADTSRCAMSLRGRFFAMTYDRFMAGTEKAGLQALRQGLLAGAGGNVLEIGGGTGANLSYYGPHVESLTLTEPETPMVRRLEPRARAQAPQAKGL